MSIGLATMRWVDRWIGAPLCTLLTPLVMLHDRCQTGKCDENHKPRRILFIELSEMGSAVIADPAMRHAMSRGTEIYFLIFSINRPSLALAGTVGEDHIFTIDPASFLTLARDVFAALLKVRNARIDTVIDLELFSRFTALLVGLSGAQRRVGFHNYHGEGLWRGNMLTHKVLYNPHQHIAKNFMALVHAAFSRKMEVPFSKIAVTDEAIRIMQVGIDDAVTASLRKRIVAQAEESCIRFEHGRDRLFLLNVNASDMLPQRRWAPERFAELAQCMAARWPRCLILLTGSLQEFDYVEHIRGLAGRRNVLNFAGKVRFPELTALYLLADLMVTNDSGPSHFSSLTRLRTVVLFGPETPVLYRSLGNSLSIHAGLSCSPCVSANNHRRTPCRNNVCMQVISSADVMTRIEQLLG